MEQRKRLFNRGKEGAAVTVGAVVMLEVVDERGVAVRTQVTRSAQQHIAALGRDIIGAPDLDELECKLTLETAQAVVTEYVLALGLNGGARQDCRAYDRNPMDATPEQVAEEGEAMVREADEAAEAEDAALAAGKPLDGAQGMPVPGEEDINHAPEVGGLSVRATGETKNTAAKERRAQT